MNAPHLVGELPAEVWTIGLSVKATAGLAIRARIAQNDEYIGPTKTTASFAAREARYCLALVDYFPPLKGDRPGERGQPRQNGRGSGLAAGHQPPVQNPGDIFAKSGLGGCFDFGLWQMSTGPSLRCWPLRHSSNGQWSGSRRWPVAGGALFSRSMVVCERTGPRGDVEQVAEFSLPQISEPHGAPAAPCPNGRGLQFQRFVG